MGKPTGFLDYDRKDNALESVRERIQNFNEFHLPLRDEERREQAARCMNCGVPLCQSAMKLSGMVTGCPLHNLIPEWNEEVYQAHPHSALSRLLKTNNFPEFTGRVCPALCEKACICGQDGDPVTTHEDEFYIIETAYRNGWMQPRIPAVRSGKRVAVVGSGPAGLAAADRLNQRGHLVTVFEREDRIGGLLMYGIPNMKLQKEVIARRQQLMEKEGVVFRTGVNVGVDVTAKDLEKEFDAVILACGAKKPRPLAVEGFEKTKGVYYAVDFLTQTTKALLADHFAESEADFAPTGLYGVSIGPVRPASSLEGRRDLVSAKGKNVVIVGGGDTGNDCVGTCIREGAKSVTQLEMMPEPPVDRLPSNPWPEWPKVKKTDYGQEEAIEVFGHDPRIYETTVKSLVTKNGKLTGINTVKVRFENRKMVEVEGSEQTLKCDLLIVAAGFIGCQDYVTDAFALPRSPRGTTVTAEGSYQTAVPGVFTAGDCHRGQSLVVWAITEGRSCAKEVDKYLMGYTNLE